MGLAWESGGSACPRYPFTGNGSRSCSARQAEPIAPVLRSAWTGRSTAAASAEELVVRFCGSAEATAAVLGAIRAGNVHAHLRTTADFNVPLDQTKTSAAVARGTWRTLADCYERRGWDSNPRGCYPYTISSRARSTGLCHLSTRPQAYPQFKGRRTGHLLHASEANGTGVLKPQPGSGDQLPGF